MTTPTVYVDGKTGFTLDLSGMRIADADFSALQPKLLAALDEMKKLEAGAIKNPDEKRKVTHFSDRLTYAESALFQDVEAFVKDVVAAGETDQVLVNGIGGSALGPQLLQMGVNGPYWNELSKAARRGFPKIYFVDNTDSAGITDALAALDLKRTMVLTVSKSGGTQETKNNMLAAEAAYKAAGIPFAPHAVAVTMEGSQLDKHAKGNNWRKVFPMADSIGGRTSETLIVGHVPAAFAGIDFARFVAGAKHMDQLTRGADPAQNPACLLAAAWHIAGNGRGDRNMVVVPYSDRLGLMGKYLQQLVMESLGKEKDLDGKVVHQGLTVYGNKGGTDAHAYIQQLNDGRDDFFVTFVELLKDAACYDMGDGMTMGDYLHGFKAGLGAALASKGRRVSEIVFESADVSSFGMLIALYERAVAIYAELIHINAFHQPGVEAYKKAAKAVNDMNLKLQAWIGSAAGWTGSAADAAKAAGFAPEQAAAVGGILDKFAVNARRFNGKTVTRGFANGAWQYAVKQG